MPSYARVALVGALLTLGACEDGEESSTPESWSVMLDWTSAQGLVVDDRGSITVALNAMSTGKLGAIEQLDADGERRFSQRLDFEPWDLAATPDGAFVVVGSRALDDGTIEAVVAHVDGREVAWSTELRAEVEDGVRSTLGARFAAVDDHGIWVAGAENRTFMASTPNPETAHRPFLARLDHEGTLLWQQNVGEHSIYELGLELGDDEDAVLGVRLNGASLNVADQQYEQSNIATLLIGFGPDGEARFSHEVGESLDDEMESLTRGSDGTLYVAGTRTRHDLPITANSIFVAATPPRGTVQFRTTLVRGHQMDEPRVAAGPDGQLVVAAGYRGEDEHGLLLVDLDERGEEQRRRLFSTADDGTYLGVTDMAVLADGSLLVLGSAQGEVELGSLRLDAGPSGNTFLARLQN